MDQTSRKRWGGCGNVLFSFAVIILAGFIAWGWYRSLPKPGQHLTLTAQPPEKFVAVMVNKDAALDYKKFTAAGDAVGLKQLLAGGMVLRVPLGETVLVIDHDWINSLYEVRVMNGAFAGERGWVVRASLKESH
jgi:hypothetical protein